MLPMISVIAVNMAYLISGATVTEKVFSWTGLGLLTIQAVVNADYPILQGIFLLLATVVVVSNFIADVINAFADPRIRYGEKKKMISQRSRFPILRVFTVGFLILMDALVATFVIQGMTSPAQNALYLLANVLFILWLVIVWRGKTAVAVSVLVTTLMVIGVTLGLDYFTATMIAISKLEFSMTLGFRVGLGALTAVSAFLIFRKMSVQFRKVQSFLWTLFSVGMGLYVSTLSLSASSRVEVFLPLGLTILVFGTVFQRQKWIGKALILAIWVFAFLK